MVNQGASVLINVLANDGGTGLTLTSLDPAAARHRRHLQNGQVLYTAPANYAGNDTFSYTETDGNNLTATATVNIDVTVQQVQVPTGAGLDFTATVVEGNSVLVDVLANDTGTGLSITSITAAPSHGTAQIQNRQNGLHRAERLCRGADSFNYTITALGGPSTASVNVTVTAAAAPVATADTVTRGAEWLDPDRRAGHRHGSRPWTADLGDRAAVRHRDDPERQDPLHAEQRLHRSGYVQLHRDRHQRSDRVEQRGDDRVVVDQPRPPRWPRPEPCSRVNQS